jgi:hypothetical protein
MSDLYPTIQFLLESVKDLLEQVATTRGRFECSPRVYIVLNTKFPGEPPLRAFQDAQDAMGFCIDQNRYIDGEYVMFPSDRVWTYQLCTNGERSPLPLYAFLTDGNEIFRYHCEEPEQFIGHLINDVRVAPRLSQMMESLSM